MMCDECGCKSTIVKKHLHNVIINGKNIRYYSDRRVCTNCGCLVYDYDLDNKASLMGLKKYNDEYGISGEKIVELRKQYGLSQEDFSKIIGCAKKTLVSYENNKSIPNDNYEIILNSLINKPQMINDLISANKSKYSEKEISKIEKRLNLFFEGIEEDLYENDPSSYNGFTKFNINKFLNAILFFAKEGVNKTKLLKELFYLDFVYYKENACSVTGSEYAHINYGPVPDNYSMYLNQFVTKGYISIDVEYKGDYEAFIINDEIEFDPFVFDSKELKMLERIKKYFINYNSSQIANYSHEEEAYKKTKIGEKISYDYSFDIKKI